MENNDPESNSTSVAHEGTDKVERSAPSTSVTESTTSPTSAPGSNVGSHEEVVAAREGSTQAREPSESQPESRDATPAEAKAAGATLTSATQSYVPPVKRFSAVNINKKFLQKNQTSTTASGGTSSTSSGSKQAGTIGPCSYDHND